ncbi:MAG: DegV family EDD domain-containing protein [Clostridiales bacterium]|jgi:DegV family protein with EDD domain|nr:DegV family EDD domain-containing protein [Clostridiales bacterium]
MNMDSSYQIITEAACGLSQDFLKQAEFLTVPMGFTIGNQNYDQVPEKGNSDLHSIYQLLRTASSAAAVTVDTSDLIEFLRPALACGKDLLYIGVSDALGETWHNATRALANLQREFPTRRIEAINSMTLSAGQGILLQHLSKLQQKGASLLEAKEWAESNVCHIHSLVAIQNPDFLVQSFKGIFSNSQNQILQITEGQLLFKEQAETRQEMISCLFKNLQKAALLSTIQSVSIVHADCEKDAQILKQMIQKQNLTHMISISFLEPIFGCQFGPDTLGLFYEAE